MTVTASPRAGGLIELHFEDGTARVKVTPSNNSLLLLSIEQAISACRAYKDQIEFKTQFDQLLNKLGSWIKPRRAKFSQAYLTLRDAGLLLLVVMKDTAYDAEIEAEITELDIEIANDTDYHLIDLSVLALPNCPNDSIGSFLSRKMLLSFVVDGDRD